MLSDVRYSSLFSIDSSPRNYWIFFPDNVKLEEQRVWSQKCLYPCQHKEEVLSLSPASSSIVLSVELACSKEIDLKRDKVVVIILSKKRAPS